MKSNAILSLSLLATFVPAVLEGAPGKAWAWVDNPQAAVSTPSLAYQFNSFGGVITVQRLFQGQWNVTIPGMTGTGVAHVSEYGGSHYCGVTVLPTHVRVFCELVDANVDARFTIFYYEEDATPVRMGGYLYAPILANENQCSVPTSVWNSSGGASTFTCGTTESQVRFYGLGPSPGNPGVAFGSRAGHNPTCGVTSWAYGTVLGSFPIPARISISCNGEGGPAFAPTSMSASLFNNVRFGELNHHGAYTFANLKSVALNTAYTPTNQFKTSSGSITVTRTGTGSYLVRIPQVQTQSSTTAIVQAVRAANENAYCSIVNWVGDIPIAGTRVSVRCHSSRQGLPSIQIDANFNLLYLTDDPI